MIVAATGAQALHLDDPLRRQFRDVHAVAAHIAFSLDAAAWTYGGAALGIDATHATI
jgi:3-hydroxy-9,10-secoandrosta-1,3,5(10)-triene-9,17-dione monooxygenase